MDARIWLIAGPTASGKSALALRLAKAAGGEIINADSMQLYGDLRILSACPTPQDQARARHHLYGIADAADAWSAGRWLRAALAAIAAVRARNRPAIVVGGTGLYFEALTAGLAEVPETPAAVRRRTRALFCEFGEAAFRERLAAVDPRANGRIAPGDRQRLIRAFEVWTATGRALSDWQAGTLPAISPGTWAGVVLDPPRTDLYRRCEARLGDMVREGAIEEVRALLARGLPASTPAMKAVGVAAFARRISGEATDAEALEQARMETRRYVKRQVTWFRNRAPDWPRIVSADAAVQWKALLAALNPVLTPTA